MLGPQHGRASHAPLLPLALTRQACAGLGDDVCQNTLAALRRSLCNPPAPRQGAACQLGRRLGACNGAAVAAKSGCARRAWPVQGAWHRAGAELAGGARRRPHAAACMGHAAHGPRTCVAQTRAAQRPPCPGMGAPGTHTRTLCGPKCTVRAPCRPRLASTPSAGLATCHAAASRTARRRSCRQVSRLSTSAGATWVCPRSIACWTSARCGAMQHHALPGNQAAPRVAGLHAAAPVQRIVWDQRRRAVRVLGCGTHVRRWATNIWRCPLSGR